MANINPSGMNQGDNPPTILMALADFDFDPSESAIPWKILTSRGWNIVFTTQNGKVAVGDLNKLKGPLPGLLSASAAARKAYQEMTANPAFLNPVPYTDIVPKHYQAILLPGGDGPRMRQYLDSSLLQEKVLEFWRRNRLVGAICHGVLVLARTIDPQTGHSILYGRKVTAVPKSLDVAAYRLDSLLTRRGYIMYPACVADEVRARLEQPEDFSIGKSLFSPYAVSDGNLITARWYLDAELFAEQFAGALEEMVRADKYTT